MHGQCLEYVRRMLKGNYDCMPMQILITDQPNLRNFEDTRTVYIPNAQIACAALFSLILAEIPFITNVVRLLS